MDEKRALAAATETDQLLRERARRLSSKKSGLLLGLATAIFIVGACFHLWPLGTASRYVQKKEPLPWTWSDIKPSQGLAWEKCYDGQFECARLDVPMDWLDPTEDQRVVLGVIKLAAKTKGKNFSPVFVNPGGPGGSGVQFVKNSGSKLQTIVGDNHDIISFDPRGVGVSTPRVECFGSSQKRKLWSLQDTPVVDERPGLVYDAYARASAYTGICEAAMAHTGIMSHLSTASAARDMLEILNKTGHARLRYWGFSYGTILGGVFAGLYPERVERLVSDGNCDYHDWFKLDHANFVSDTDKIFDAFDSACHKAGLDGCALWAESPEAVQARRGDLLDRLRIAPVLIPANSHADGPDLPVLVTYSKLQKLTQGVLYKPQKMLPQLARVYAALEAGDGLPYYDMMREHTADEPGQLCLLGDKPATMPFETGSELDAFPAIICSDGEPVKDTPEEFGRYADKLSGVSKWAGAVNLLFRVSCIGKTVRPKWRFSDDDFQGDTAHPILYIGNLADNVTPLESAFNNSARFPSSVVLKQNAYGHCSLAAASTCTARHIRAYFQHGTLPQRGSECDPDYDLLGLPTDQQAVVEDELAAAVFELAHEVDLSMGFW
ncbi:TAP-like protein-domain-containing protein [Dactylonectria estremocensis]|uniref:TAP-like protein-domain-containing protein n=1 Tax=Dactylonectria estremocensis TaxID=1079267 RepID=A0A9P9FHJ5_9HYPO|nr:TAP-like protein-domain-containing protein [Dactylonectria estremocensis]